MENIHHCFLWVDGNDENYRKKYCIKNLFFLEIIKISLHSFI